MQELNNYITVDVNGLTRVNFLDREGNMCQSPVAMTKHEADVVMNCTQAGYWVEISEGLIVAWEIKGDDREIRRIIEISTTSPEPIEYEQVPFHEADMAFMIGANHETGVPFYIGNYLSENPFASTFSESQVLWFNDLEGIDKVIQRGYIANVMERFHGMWHNGKDRDLHIVWAKIKD